MRTILVKDAFFIFTDHRGQVVPPTYARTLETYHNQIDHPTVCPAVTLGALGSHLKDHSSAAARWLPHLTSQGPCPA